MNEKLIFVLTILLGGVTSVLFGTLIGFVVGYTIPSQVPEECKNWNHYYVMELSLFLTGISTALVTKFLSLN